MTTALTLRASLSRPLSVEEGDANLINLRDGIDAAMGALAQQKARNPLNARDTPFSAQGDGTADDTVALQAAIDAAQDRTGGELYLPEREEGYWYQISAPLRITKPITLRGAGAHAAAIIGVGFSASQHLLEIDCLAVDNVEHIRIEGLTLRSLDGVPKGILLKNASYVSMRDVRLFNLSDGLVIDGTRCFSNDFDGLVNYGIENASVQFAPTFSGGGQFTFRRSTFVGAHGVRVRAGAATDGLGFDGCNWEGCTTRDMLVEGTVQGLNIEGARVEAGGGHGFELAPVAGSEVTGLSITGMTFYKGTASARPIILGTNAGTGGAVRGFSICGNRTGTAAVDYFCVLHSEVQSGIIAGNKFDEVATLAVSAPRNGVIVFGNESGSARLPEHWGLADWGVEQGAWTPTDGSGAGLTLAVAVGRYTKIGRTVFWQATIQYGSTASTAAAEIGGLPFSVGGLDGSAEGRGGAQVNVCNVGSPVGILQGFTSSNEFAFFHPTDQTPILNVTLSGKSLFCSGTYTI